MTPYRLLALDLDGTTLNEEKQISTENKKWIQRAAQDGVYVIFATGRGFQNVTQFREELELQSPMVLLNGAEIWLDDHTILERHFIPNEVIRELHRIALEEDAWFWGYSTEGLCSRRTWQEAMFAQSWMKFGICHEDPTALQRLWMKTEQLGTLELTHSAINNIEISVKGITKETGVQTVCRHLGIQMNGVIAVGDSLNDAALLRAAGFGVAMGNAEEAIKQLADYITVTNEQDGVAKAIQHCFYR